MTDLLKREYCKQGFLKLERLWPEHELIALVREVHDVFAYSMASRKLPCTRDAAGRILDDDVFRFFDVCRQDYIAVLRVIQNLPRIFRLGTADTLLRALGELGLERPVFSSRPILTLSSPRTSSHIGHWKTPAHQDWRSIQGSLDCVVVWIPLADVTPELGQIEVIPGSHIEGLLPAEPDEWYMHVRADCIDPSRFRPIPARLGDALIFSAFLVHRSGTNLLSRHRYALQFRFDNLAEPNFVSRSFPTAYVSDRPAPDLVTPGFPSTSELRAVFGTE